jgi:hypothetical protein
MPVPKTDALPLGYTPYGLFWTVERERGEGSVFNFRKAPLTSLVGLVSLQKEWMVGFGCHSSIEGAFDPPPERERCGFNK